MWKKKIRTWVTHEGGSGGSSSTRKLLEEIFWIIKVFSIFIKVWAIICRHMCLLEVITWYIEYLGVVCEFGASLMAQTVNNPFAMQQTWVRFLGWEDTLEEKMATHSSILAWRSLWTKEPGRVQSTASQRVGHWVTECAHAHTHEFYI